MSDLAHTAKSSGNAMTALGVIAIILGVLALLAPGLTGLSVVTLLGGLVIAAGIVRMIWAFKAESLGRGLLVFAIGGLTFLCGIALIANPLFTATALTILLAVYFVVDGVAEIVAGFRLRPAASSGWMVFGGVVSILLAAIIWSQFPLSGIWAIGILLGIKLFFIGLLMITGGSAVREIGQEISAKTA